MASGIVAGLVAVTPASGFVYMWGGLVIGLIAGIVCYVAVCLKPFFKYDDSLDAFGVHGVGGFLGAILTGVFCYRAVNPTGADGLFGPEGGWSQVGHQFVAAGASVALAFVGSFVLVKVIDTLLGFTTDARSETEGLDRTEHGEVGFDYGAGLEVISETVPSEPRAASSPPDGHKRFTVVVEGVDDDELTNTWSELCQAGAQPPASEFRTVYPYMTTVQKNRFQFRGGDPSVMRDNLHRLLQSRLQEARVQTRVEEN